jgi:hypothetical protein
MLFVEPGMPGSGTKRETAEFYWWCLSVGWDAPVAETRLRKKAETARRCTSGEAGRDGSI